MKTPPINPNPPGAANQRSWWPNGCLQSMVLGFVILVFIGIMLPVFNTVNIRSGATKALAQSKQIGLALKLFAGDNDGYFPRQGVPVEIKEPPPNANVAFACLFPTYTQSETIFGNKSSAYGTRTPDNVIDSQFDGKPIQTLQPGENVYGYVMGLKDSGPQDAPLIVDGTDGSRHYNQAEGVRGKAWKGKKAVAIRVDNSGTLEPLEGPDNTLYLPRRDDRTKNALDVGYLGKDVRYLDPAVAGP